MKAVVQTGIGGVDKIEIRDLPDPKPGPGEVKIKVAAASINPIDWKVLHGMRPTDLPWVMGYDVAGEVLETGSGVSGFQKGDRVLGNIRHSFAEYVIAEANDIARIPDRVTIEEAAALLLVATTGAQLIEEHTKPGRGQTVLVTGALGGVGRSAVYAAKQSGAKVLVGVKGSQKEQAKQLGADEIIALDDAAEIDKLPEVDAIADTIGGETINKLLPHLKKGGRLGSVLGVPDGAKGRDIIVDAFKEHPDGRRLQELVEAVGRGELKIPIGKTFPFAQVQEAMRYAEDGHGGKVLLTM